MKSPKNPILTLGIVLLSLLCVANPAQAVISESNPAVAQGVPIPRGSRVIMVDVSGWSGPQSIRVQGPAGLDRRVRVNGDFGLMVKQPGTYRLRFSDVHGREWRYPSQYVRTVVVPAAPGVKRVAVSYQRSRLRFDGIGHLWVGMTFAQAMAADPSVRADLDYGCLQATSNVATLFFNPTSAGGRLSMIMLKPGVRTTAGVRVGSSYQRAQRAYDFQRKTLNSNKWDFIRVSPSYASRGGREASTRPFIGVEFEDGPAKNRREFWINHSRVSSVFLDAGQKCVN